MALIRDLAGRLTQLALPIDTGDVHTTYAYDDSGLLTGMSLPESSTVAYGYDAAGRMASIDATTASGTLGFVPKPREGGTVLERTSALARRRGLRIAFWMIVAVSALWLAAAAVPRLSEGGFGWLAAASYLAFPLLLTAWAVFAVVLKRRGQEIGASYPAVLGILLVAWWAVYLSEL